MIQSVSDNSDLRLRTIPNVSPGKRKFLNAETVQESAKRQLAGLQRESVTQVEPQRVVELRKPETIVTLEECLSMFLKEHQKVAVARILEQKRVILADEMGLGKTLTTLATILTILRQQKEKAAPFLIVCPADLISTWESETEKLNTVLRNAGLKPFSLKIAAYSPNQKKPIPDNVDILLVNYEKFACSDHFEKLVSQPWSGIVCDESQAIKTFESKRSGAVAKACALVNPSYVVLLSGTPMENRLGELCGQLHVLNPEVFDHEWHLSFQLRVSKCVKEFVERHLNANFAEGDEEKRAQIRQLIQDALKTAEEWKDCPSELERLRKVMTPGDALLYARHLIQTYVLKRSKLEIGSTNLLSPIIQDLDWKMDPWQLKLYDQFLTAYSDKEKSIKNPIVLLTKLGQLCNHPSLLPENYGVYLVMQNRGFAPLKASTGKLEALTMKLKEVMGNRSNRSLIFVHQRETGRMVQQFLKTQLNLDVRFVTGEDTPGDRDDKIRASKEGTGDSDRVLIITDGTGSVGRNLTEYNHLFCVDMPWNKNKWDQQIARIYRQGQTQQPYVYAFRCSNNPFAINLDKVYQLMYRVKQTTINSSLAPDIETLIDLFFDQQVVRLAEIFQDLENEKREDVAPAVLDAVQKEIEAVYDMLTNDEDFKDLEVDYVERKKLETTVSRLNSQGFAEQIENEQGRGVRPLMSWTLVEDAVEYFFQSDDESDSEQGADYI